MNCPYCQAEFEILIASDTPPESFVVVPLICSRCVEVSLVRQGEMVPRKMSPEGLALIKQSSLWRDHIEHALLRMLKQRKQRNAKFN